MDLTWETSHPMVRVQWVDSTTHHGWEYYRPGQEPMNMRVTTCAYLLGETDDELILSDSIAFGDGQDKDTITNTHCVQQIPCGAVVSIELLEVVAGGYATFKALDNMNKVGGDPNPPETTTGCAKCHSPKHLLEDCLY